MKNPNSKCRRKMKRGWKKCYGNPDSPFESRNHEREFWKYRHKENGNPHYRWYYNKIQ